MADTGARFDRLADGYERVIPFIAELAQRLEVSAALSAADFVDVRTVNIEVHIPVLDPQSCWDFHMSQGFAGRVEALGASDAARVRQRALTELAPMHESGGIVVDRGAVVHLEEVRYLGERGPGGRVAGGGFPAFAANSRIQRATCS